MCNNQTHVTSNLLDLCVHIFCNSTVRYLYTVAQGVIQLTNIRHYHISVQLINNKGYGFLQGMLQYP